MSATTTNEPNPRCKLCGEVESPPTVLLVAGFGVPVCCDCDEKFRVVFRQHLEPVAEAARAPLDQLMSTVAYGFTDGHWVVQLFTLKPGLVIGPGGVTVDPIRQSLVTLTGDERLQLDLRQLDTVKNDAVS